MLSGDAAFRCELSKEKPPIKGDESSEVVAEVVDVAAIFVPFAVAAAQYSQALSVANESHAPSKWVYVGAGDWSNPGTMTESGEFEHVVVAVLAPPDSDGETYSESCDAGE